MTKLIINGDDFGMTDGICRAIRDLLNTGALSSTSVMVAFPGATSRCKKWGVSSLRGVAGVHLQLTKGGPVLATNAAESLLDHHTDCFAEGIESLPPELVLQEWRAQIDLAAHLIGDRPSHLDSHCGVHHLPQFVDVYVALAHEYGLPVRGGSELVQEQMKHSGVIGPDEVLFDWTGHNAGMTRLQEQLLVTANALGRHGTIEVVTHPAYCDEELMAVSSLNTARDGDRLALEELARTNWLEQNSFLPIPYSMLRAEDSIG